MRPLQINGIEAVLFDYGMVLSGPPDPTAWAKLRRLTGLSEEDLHARYWAHRPDYDRGILTGDRYWVIVTSGTHLSPDTARSLIAADTELWTQPNLPMIEWAAHLRSIGIRTGILSNLGDAMQLGVASTFPWIADFHHCTWSHALKMTKPDPAIYRHAAEGLATPPDAILFLDDREENIAAARETGMFAMQYTDHESFLRDLAASGFEALLPPSSGG